mmetsp:Transcript_97934/g.275618  ORF Transcript_97934/g.275618 Transcript_97934/m.275618 type:complete len:314 (+) Transcript_97934:31-972(+)
MTSTAARSAWARRPKGRLRLSSAPRSRPPRRPPFPIPAATAAAAAAAFFSAALVSAAGLVAALAALVSALAALALALAALALALVAGKVGRPRPELHRQPRAEAGRQRGERSGATGATRGTPGASRRRIRSRPLCGRLPTILLLDSESSVVVPELAHIDLPVGLILDFPQEVPALTASGHVKVAPEVIPPLIAALASAELPALGDTGVPVHADDPVVEDRLVQQVRRLGGLLVRRKLHEAEPARRLFEPVQAHDNPLDLSTLPEELVHLPLVGVEGKVANVQGSRDLDRSRPLGLRKAALFVKVYRRRRELLV